MNKATAQLLKYCIDSHYELQELLEVIHEAAFDVVNEGDEAEYEDILQRIVHLARLGASTAQDRCHIIDGHPGAEGMWRVIYREDDQAIGKPTNKEIIELVLQCERGGAAGGREPREHWLDDDEAIALVRAALAWWGGAQDAPESPETLANAHGEGGAQNAPVTEADDLQYLGLPSFAGRVLRASGVKTVGMLTSLTLSDLMRLPNVGRKTLKAIRETLHVHGLSLSGEAHT